MSKKILLILLLIFPACLLAQSLMFNKDTASLRIMKNDCDGKIFTRVETLPSLKIPKDKFEDTLMSVLKMKKRSYNDGNIRFKFLVTTQSQIFDLAPDFGEIENEKAITKALLQLSDLWQPARQNGHKVCAFVRLEIDIAKNELHIGIVP